MNKYVLYFDDVFNILYLLNESDESVECLSSYKQHWVSLGGNFWSRKDFLDCEIVEQWRE
jgi:hypothetical protein